MQKTARTGNEGLTFGHFFYEPEAKATLNDQTHLLKIEGIVAYTKFGKTEDSFNFDTLITTDKGK